MSFNVEGKILKKNLKHNTFIKFRIFFNFKAEIIWIGSISNVRFSFINP